MAVVAGKGTGKPERESEDGTGRRRRVSILGSTGSVGCQTIDLIERQRDGFEVEALTAHRNAAKLAQQAQDLDASLAVVADPQAYRELKDALSGTAVEVTAGPEALIEAASRSVDWTMAAIVGAAGLAPTLAAVRRCATVAFANKEVLVCAGELMTREVGKSNAKLLPVDSEHNAIFQVFDAEDHAGIEKLILTASGGPFRTYRREQMAEVTPGQAVAHPNWDMGAKISVDSATMMNKGLEIIEAHHLFRMEESAIEVLVHPQSIIHSMVAYVDGSVLAQLGTPDMRTPIAHTLAWPRRMASPSLRLDLAAIGTLSFEEPDPIRFPALRLAREALRSGGLAPTLLNAANEVAVHSFLTEKIGFLDISSVVEQTLERMPAAPMESLDQVAAVDAEARGVASACVAEIARR
ncbi:MAG: 1-deoxy-D-xylulose-5-phosphate reductoisomerase [Kiloniellales bacterium]